MSDHKFNFELVERYIRKKTFGILTTADKDGKPHSVGMIYAVSSPNTTFSLYCITAKKSKKVKNIQENPNIAFVIPFPHHIFRFAPSSCIQFQGLAELLSLDNSEARLAFSGKKLLKMNIKEAERLRKEQGSEAIFIKIKPHKKIYCYGIGIGLMEMRKDISAASYSVEIPNN